MSTIDIDGETLARLVRQRDPIALTKELERQGATRAEATSAAMRILTGEPSTPPPRAPRSTPVEAPAPVVIDVAELAMAIQRKTGAPLSRCQNEAAAFAARGPRQ
jgi:hypothetical protein